MRLILLGPPGAGKGTQGKFIQRQYEICQISTGEILRKAAEEQSPLGKKASQYLDKGKLVPDKVMVNLVTERLRREDCKRGFILDGFPRTVAQADSLEEMIREMGLKLDGVLYFRVPQGVVIQRLARRRTCKRCSTLDYYRRKGLVTEIDGDGSVEVIRNRVLGALEGLGK